MPASRSDENPTAARRSSERLDPSFLRRLEDDSLWPSDRQLRPQRVRPPRREKRSRLLAIIALLVAALIILITGVVGGSDGSGSSGGQSAPFRLLPITNDVVTSTVPETAGSLLSP